MVHFNTSSKSINLLLFSYFLIIGFSLFLSAVTISDDLHLNIQVTNSNGVATTGTYAFAFNISNSTDCAVANIVYSNLTTKDTDVRGIVSIYLNNVTLDFNQQYWLCYYRNGTLVDTLSFAKTPYSYRALNINLTNVTANSNFTSNYNITAQWFLGQLNWSNITNKFISAVDNIFVYMSGTNLTLNETRLNQTINASIDLKAGTLSSNNSQYLNGSNASFYMPNNKSVFGTFNFNGGWQSSGLTIQNGDLYAQTVYVYNLTSLTVNSLLVNGSIIPQFGWDNVFDIGNASLRYRNITLGGNASINGSLYLFNNITLGDSSSDYIIANGLVASHFTPIDNSRDLGTSANRWRTAYVDVLNANSVAAGEVNISGTNFDTFTIHTNNTGDDPRNVSLAFERGTPIINAIIKWDSTNGSKRFDFNFPVYLQPDTNLTIDNFFFVDSLNNRLGIGNTTPASTLTIQGTFNLSNSSNYQVLTSSADGNVTVDTSTLFVDSISNRVGVVTTSPQNTLNVVGDLNATTSVFSQGNNLSLAYFYATNSTSWSQVTNGTMSSWANAVNGTLTTWVQSINGTLARTDAANTFGAFNQTFNQFIFYNKNLNYTGINTTTPQNTLNVLGTLNISSSNANLGLYQDSNGKVGINDTSAGTVFNVLLNGTSTTNNIVSVMQIGVWNNGTAAAGLGPYIAFRGKQSNGDMGAMGRIAAFWEDPTASAKAGGLQFWTTSATLGERESMRINASGQVGINTTSPMNTLNVVGDLNVTNGTSGNNGFIGLFVNKSNSVFIGGTSTNNAITSGNTAVLQVNGENNTNGTVVINAESSGLNTAGIDFVTGNTTRRTFIGWRGNYSAPLTVPVNGSAVYESGVHILNYDNSPISFSTTQTLRGLIDAAGNWGINTTTPQNTLNVVGNFNVSTNASAAFAGTGGNCNFGVNSVGEVGFGYCAASLGSMLYISGDAYTKTSGTSVMSVYVLGSSGEGAWNLNFFDPWDSTKNRTVMHMGSLAGDHLWFDDSNILRTQAAMPTGAANGTVVGTQTSTLDTKDVNYQFTNYSEALQTIVNTPLYNFTYKNNKFNNESFVGIITDYSPIFGFDRDIEHPQGKSFNEVTAFGYTVAAIKEQQHFIENLTIENQNLKSQLSSMQKEMCKKDKSYSWC